MRKRILSVLLALCMVICLVPTSVFAEGVTSKKVETQQELVAALADDTVDVIKLGSDIAIDATLNITRTVTLDLVGYMLEMKGSGSVITVKNGGHLTLNDSDLTSTYYFTPNADGLWKWGTSGTKTVNGGVIYGGTGTEMYYSTYGGGVLIEDGCQFTMNGGSIVGCKADGAGGGVVVKCGDANGIFTMNGGAIIGCVADSGGGVETDGGGVGEYGQFIMNGGVIDSCVATGRTGGGGVRSDGLFIMGKDATIKNCKAVENGQLNFGSGIVLAGDDLQTINGTIISEDAVDGKYIFVSNRTVTIGENANIHANITLEGGKIDLDGSSATVYGKITNDNYGGASCYADGLVAVTYQVNGADYATKILRSGSPATQPTAPAKSGYDFTGWFTSDGTKWDFATAVTENTTLASWLYLPVTNKTELNAALADDKADVIRLTGNIDIDTTLNITRSLTLDLNDHVLKMTGSSRVFEVYYPDTCLTLTDTAETKTPKYFDRDESTGLWTLTNDTTSQHTFSGGVITGGSAISVFLNGEVIMNGGSIVGCSAERGGAVVVNGGTFEMNSGAIIGCTADDGGGVYVFSGTFTMNGGSIEDCTANGGGAVLANGGTFELTNGEIKNCTATDGSALYLRSRMNANGGTVDGTVVLDVKNNGDKGIIQGSGSTATHFSGAVTNYGEIKHGTFSGTVTLGNSTLSGKITGGTFNGPVTTDSEGEAKISGGVFNKTVTINRGEITNGTFNKDVVVYNALASFSCTKLTGGTYNGLIINKSAYAAFVGAHSSLGIVGEKPSYNPGTYFKVTFEPAGGEIDYPVRYFFEDGNISSEIKPAPRTGYTFGGWYKADGTAWDFTKDTVTENITLSAKWIPHTYKLTFDANGGTVSQKTMQVTYGEKLSNVPIPQRYGYVFDGWFDKQNGGKQYCDEKGRSTSQYDKTENCTLYAHWKEVKCKVKFDAKGGTLSGPAELNKKQNERLDRPDNPVREGYSFAGWYKDADCTKEWNFDDLISGDMTLYAGWTVNSYKITIKPDNGDKDIVISRNFGSDITAPKLTKTGYTFNGWDKEIPKTMPAHNMTIKAKWKVNSYTITFDTAGGSEIAPITQNYGTAITTPADPTREGYTFLGWDKEIPKTMPAKNITVKAIWKDIESPVISGLSDGKAYCYEVKFKVSDNEGIKSVKVSGKKLTADKDGYYTLTSKLSKAEISAEDFEGNITKLTVSVNDGHTLDLIKENGKYYKKCSVCGYKTEKNDVPKITDGDGLTVTFGDRKPLSFRSTAPIDEFIRAELDGEALDEKYYNKKEGSTVITLNEDFVSTLSVGKHTLSIVSVGGTATAEFTVNAPVFNTPETSPKTGYAELFITLLGVAFIFGGIFIKSLKKKA